MQRSVIGLHWLSSPSEARYIAEHPSDKIYQRRGGLTSDEVQEVMVDLTNLAFTCKEMSQLVVKLAVPVVGRRVSSCAWNYFGVPHELPPYWQSITARPAHCTVEDLRVSHCNPIFRLEVKIE